MSTVFKELTTTTSKRERFIYTIFATWTIFGILGMYTKADLDQLSKYFEVFFPYALAYLGAETFRESGKSLKIPKIK